MYVVHNENGETVATAITPAKVSLKRGQWHLRKPPRYVATIAKPGFQPTRVPINPKMNPWVAGNLLIGGPVGLAADSATGAFWRHSPAEIKTKRHPAPTERNIACPNHRMWFRPLMYLIEESRATARDFATWDFDTHSKLVRSFKFVYRSIHAEDEINSAPTLFGMLFSPATGTTHFLLGIVPSFSLGSSRAFRCRCADL